METFLAFTCTLSLMTIVASSVVICSLLKIKKSSVPFCLSWLGRGLVCSSLAAIFFIVWSFTKKAPCLLMTEYLTVASLYLYALWQTKFTLYKSKTHQKVYILLLNVMLALLAYKYILRLSTESVSLLPADHMLVPSVVDIMIFFLLYLSYCLCNLHNDKDKVKNTVNHLYVALGLMIICHLVQLMLLPLTTKLSSGEYSSVANQHYQWHFAIVTSIKLSLNFMYVLITQIQVDVDKGRFLEDTPEVKDVIK